MHQWRLKLFLIAYQADSRYGALFLGALLCLPQYFEQSSDDRIFGLSENLVLPLDEVVDLGTHSPIAIIESRLIE